ncbi:pro-glucagon [Microcaecilia unicolor]|uniref:Glucagon n=1 Tax=Microcaecilia unicolor TaxID=1415580 RepID=A0A6P7YL73_9AMPH|nr:glucagon [Microcaecilia unicolor]
MKIICCLAGMLLMLIQGSWQNPLQDIEDKSRLFTLSQFEPFDESSQMMNAVKRHSQGTFTSDYSKYLDNKKAQEFVNWLMNNKRNGGVSRRHADGTYTSDISSYLEGQAAKKFVDWLLSEEGRRLDLLGEY